MPNRQSSIQRRGKRLSLAASNSQTSTEPKQQAHRQTPPARSKTLKAEDLGHTAEAPPLRRSASIAALQKQVTTTIESPTQGKRRPNYSPSLQGEDASKPLSKPTPTARRKREPDEESPQPPSKPVQLRRKQKQGRRKDHRCRRKRRRVCVDARARDQHRNSQRLLHGRVIWGITDSRCMGVWDISRLGFGT
ncbi:hypothetical protein VTI74DRAFT_11216 [Chaetomium olivicolor]